MTNILFLTTVAVESNLLLLLFFIALANRGKGGALDFRGDHLIFRRTNGGISRN